MLKKVTSMDEINQGDVLLFGPQPKEDKPYTIKNVASGHVYAIRENGSFDLKLITTYSLSVEDWWKET
jgi:hypothetical protein